MIRSTQEKYATSTTDASVKNTSNGQNAKIKAASILALHFVALVASVALNGDQALDAALD